MNPIFQIWKVRTDISGRDLFARDAEQASVVNVASKAYRRVALYEPGKCFPGRRISGKVPSFMQLSET